MESGDITSRNIGIRLENKSGIYSIKLSHQSNQDSYWNIPFDIIDCPPKCAFARPNVFDAGNDDSYGQEFDNKDSDDGSNDSDDSYKHDDDNYNDDDWLIDRW